MGHDHEQLIFDTVEAQRILLDAAASATKSARRQVERRSRSLGAAGQVVGSKIVASGAEDDPALLPVLAVEEWS